MQTSVNTTLRLLFASQAKGKRKLVRRRVESGTGAVALASRWLLGCFRRARLNPVWRNSVSCSRSSNRTGRFPASGSRKRHTMFRVTPSATSERDLGVARLIVNPRVLRCFLRPSLTEAPSLRRSYPASPVLRTSPPPHTARPVSRELPVDPYCDHRWGFPCCVWSPVPTCHRHYPGKFDGAGARRSPSPAAFPVKKSGRLLQLFFRGLLSVHSCYGLHARRVAKRPSPPKAPTASLPPLPLRLLPGGANQFPVGSCTR